ncbi:MAG: hypothetical protein U0796_22470 [Gemmatales bacterium]
MAIALLLWSGLLQQQCCATSHLLPTVRLLSSTPQGALVFQVTNPTKAMWYFQGYGPTYFQTPLPAGKISPISHIERFRQGEWRTDFDGRCGVGITRVELPAGAKATFTVMTHLVDREPIRVRLTFFATKEASQPFTLKSETVRHE